MTTHFTRHFYRQVGVLAGLSLLVSLLVVAPSPIKAADPAPDYPAAFEACPEGIIPGADFSDVPARHDNAHDIDCIAYYGITKGTSPTTYSPSDPVIREHMALFLIRLAKLVGIGVPVANSSTPFTDIADLTGESRDAINQLVRLGITIGTSSTTYTPDRNVSRGEMALFLQRLMNLMDPVADGRDVYGYTPADVDDNDEGFEVESPFRDLNNVTVAIGDAVAQLYELGVLSGYSSTTFYGPNEDMSRSAMAEFMAAILDHSNLRPEGVMVQMSPTQGLDDFDIAVMISLRDAGFRPLDDEPVDWFYTDDPDGGLERNGTCDLSLILGRGDCVWEEDDDETNDDGDIFEEFSATPGETMIFYAWVGGRDGDDFDEDTATFSKAEATSAEGPSSILVRHDIPADAFQIDDAFIVDLDRRSLVEFIIQLRDDDGNDLEMEGVEIEIEVESIDILVKADELIANVPDPDYEDLGGDDDFSITLLTDSDGEAIFELDAPRRYDRWDEVVVFPDCDCQTETIEVAWSAGDPVLVAAIPEFDSYRYRSGANIRFIVEYNLYDQYGTALRSTTFSNTGRDGTVTADLAYDVYKVASAGGTTTKTITDLGAAEDMTITRGRITHTANETITDTDADYFIVLRPRIFSDADGDSNNDGADDVNYVDSDVVAWIVEDAAGSDDLPADCGTGDISGVTGLADVTLTELDVNIDEREFRTCFTLWSYDSNDRFIGDEGEINIDEFEARLATITTIDAIEVTVYSTRTSGTSILRIS